jgi:hypothetical protein
MCSRWIRVAEPHSSTTRVVEGADQVVDGAVQPLMSLANPYPQTPAMAAGVSDHVLKIEEIVALLDERQPT